MSARYRSVSMTRGREFEGIRRVSKSREHPVILCFAFVFVPCPREANKEGGFQGGLTYQRY